MGWWEIVAPSKTHIIALPSVLAHRHIDVSAVYGMPTHQVAAYLATAANYAWHGRTVSDCEGVGFFIRAGLRHLVTPLTIRHSLEREQLHSG